MAPATRLDLPAGREVYGDAGYTDYEQGQLYRTGAPADWEQIALKIERKSNSPWPDQSWEAAYKKGLRQRIEQVFRGPPGDPITMRFARKLHAITEAGFLIKIVLFLLAYALETNLDHTT